VLNLVVYVKADDLRKFAHEVLVKVGVPDEYAKIVADHLVLAELRGISSHGIMRLPLYVEGIMKGEINPKPQIKIIREGMVHALIDGDNGIGQVVAFKATNIAISKAKKIGIGIAGARNLRHVGMLAYYIMKIIENEMIGVAMANASPTVAPLGCKRPITGTNPLAIGFPVRDKPPIILDMATSIVARGKILAAIKKGEKIPEGWAMNKEGKITTDPKEAAEGILLPFGGYKGFGLALIIDIISGIMTGGNYSLKMRRGWYTQGGFFVAAIRIDIFRPYDEYLREIKEYIERVKATPTVKGVEVLLPGEPEFRTYIKRLESGLPIDEEIFNELKNLANKFNVPIPQIIK